tara:strand:- start:1175 stop:1636 length:462 start_codon:yes stop_codon:yes gene_type:complete
MTTDSSKNYTASREEEFTYLRYFEGKICSILLRDVALWQDFNSQQFTDYCVGHVDFVGMMGIWTTNVVTKGRNFYRWEHIAGIIEEQFIPEDHPDYDKIKKQVEEKQIKKQKVQMQQPMPSATGVPEWLTKSPNDKRVNVDALSDITKQAKEE